MSWKLLSKLFSKEEVFANTISNTYAKLKEALEVLENKEKTLLEKVAAEVERSEDFTKANNMHGAIQCLKNKSFYEQQIEELGNYQVRIREQMIVLDRAQEASITVAALKHGIIILKRMHKTKLTKPPNTLSKLFGSKKEGDPANRFSNSLKKMTEEVDILEKEKACLEKAVAEIKKAKEFTKANLEVLFQQMDLES